ncbi:RecX family transcriptional regulator [Flavobacterium sp.]|uniref:regulatory protein RecX n=1 Tax=Flavobacterium sp. TaxID=239 RepID=UPI002610C0A5|nr:RecX family transcriptional regulator [Flavobacterium sp.]
MALHSKSGLSVQDVLAKLEYYCAYQERCHAEVWQKLQEFTLLSQEKDEIIVALIQKNFLNEERFALVFAQSKFHQKKWGKIRIKNELKSRQVNELLIQKALKTIPSETYESTFEQLASQNWESIRETNLLKKKKKFCDFLARKGWEHSRIMDWLHEQNV